MRKAQRKALAKRGLTVYKDGSYPIDTPKRARNALARAAQKGTKGSYATVAKAVRRKYGNRIASVGKARGTVTRAGYRKRRR